MLRCVPDVCVVYLPLFLRAFSRAWRILWSVGVRFPELMSAALSRAERAEIGRSSLGDDCRDGGSVIRGGFSTAAILTASMPASENSGGDGDGVNSTGGGVGEGGVRLIVCGADRAGVSISRGVSLCRFGTEGSGKSGIRAGDRS